MAKTLTLFLSTSPYSYENTHSVVGIADAALSKGHSVNVVASADGVYCFLKKQKAKGITNAEEKFSALIKKGLKVYIWGGCLNFRRAAQEDYLEGAEVGSIKGLFRTMEESDIWLNIGA